MIIMERLKELLRYSPSTGELFWLVKSARRIAIGSVAGYVEKDGYRRIRIDGKRYAASRLAWFYMTGKWPVLDIDHEDTDKDNNRWINLREADIFQNSWNKNKLPGTTCKYKGVSRWKSDGRFHAEIIVNKKRIYLGTFDSEEEGAAVYREAASTHFGKFARF